MSAGAAEEALTAAFRADGGRILAALIAQFRDFDLAEEALADALAEASRSWGAAPPARPGAWLHTVARRRAIDRIRRGRRPSQAAEAEVSAMLHDPGEPPEDAEEIPDERLRLIFTCCHPALAVEAQVALTLRTLGGLTVEEIARAFLVPVPTMAQRLTRAKRKIRAAAIPYRVPETAELPPRLAAVLAVLYLIFNEGHSASQGAAPMRAELTAEAIRLTEILLQLMPEPEVGGLLALMVLHNARAPARLDADGALVPLELQDRSRWRLDEIARGTRLVHLAMSRHRPGPYQIQAAISAMHCAAPSWEDTDWRQIAGLYAALERIEPSPVVHLNHAVARANAGELEEALAAIEALRPTLDGYQPYHAAEADLRRRAGDPAGARAAYARAIALSGNAAERAFLSARRDALRGTPADHRHTPPAGPGPVSKL
ncbi:MAG: sigma-70 family RNA polymerase sigma factor [Pseudomonadota bacterium]